VQDRVTLGTGKKEYKSIPKLAREIFIKIEFDLFSNPKKILKNAIGMLSLVMTCKDNPKSLKFTGLATGDKENQQTW